KEGEREGQGRRGKEGGEEGEREGQGRRGKERGEEGEREGQGRRGKERGEEGEREGQGRRGKERGKEGEREGQGRRGKERGNEGQGRRGKERGNEGQGRRGKEEEREGQGRRGKEEEREDGGREGSRGEREGERRGDGRGGEERERKGQGRRGKEGGEERGGDWERGGGWREREGPGSGGGQGGELSEVGKLELPPVYDPGYRINLTVLPVPRGSGSVSRGELRAFRQALRHYASFRQRRALARLAELAASRRALPVAAHRARLLELTAERPCLVLAGDTGCGKSTQVAQYLAEEWEARGQGGRVACTQPRRVACLSLARRVALESLRRSWVGYRVRFEASEPPGGARIVFLTEGLLLRQLQTLLLGRDGIGVGVGVGDGNGVGDGVGVGIGDGVGVGAHQGLAGFRAILLDEAHERRLHTDLLLGLLRALQAGRPSFCLILMSATLDVGLFARYLGHCPVLQVPGRLFPIKVRAKVGGEVSGRLPPPPSPMTTPTSPQPQTNPRTSTHDP
ncbi:hypothetical protein chiPu_0025394, partial [Chiloscyllium punctatum]|nr:hypothetical protein [Chiloscyllium punctatum]